MPRGVYKRKPKNVTATSEEDYMSGKRVWKKKRKAKARRAKAGSSSDVGAEPRAKAWSIDREDVPVELDAKDAKIYEQAREIVHLNARLSERDGRLAAQRDNLLFTLELLAEGSLRLVRAVRQQE